MKKCFYLNPDLRPEGWEMRGKGAGAMLAGIEKDSALKEQYKDALKEIKDLPG